MGLSSVRRIAGSAAAAVVLAVPGTAGATAPTISSFTPPSAPAGTVVSIYGSFPGATAVRFGSVAANFQALSNTKILAVVPSAAVTAPIRVTTPAGTATSGSDFAVAHGIVAFPRSAPPGGRAKLSGSGLPANTSFTISLDGHAAGSGHTNGVGGFGGVSFNVPLSVAFGPQDLTVDAPGDSISIHFLIQDDWPFARYDVESTGDSFWEGTLNTGNVAGLVAKWSFTAAAPVGLETPIVVGGVVYVASNDGHVYAVDASSHAKIWTAQPNTTIGSSPAVSGGSVYVVDNGILYALSAQTGKKLWSFATSGSSLSDPVAANGQVFLTGWDGNASTVWALDASSGNVLWTKEVSPANIIGSVSISATRVFVGDDNGNVFALNRTTGAIAFKKTPGGLIEAHPCVGGTLVWVAATGASGDDLIAYNQTTGAKQWSRKLNVNYTTPSYGGGRLFVVTNAGVVAVNPTTGATLWSYPAASTFDDTSVAVANGVAYASVGGKVVALNAATGVGLWSTPTTYTGPMSSPVVVNGRIYFGAQDKIMRVFGL